MCRKSACSVGSAACLTDGVMLLQESWACVEERCLGPMHFCLWKITKFPRFLNHVNVYYPEDRENGEGILSFCCVSLNFSLKILV